MGLTSFASRIKEYCAGRNLFSGVSCLIVGLSGGPDSVALLLALDEIRKETKTFPSIYAVHVNHGLRSSAKEDEILATNLCLKLEIPITTYEFDVSQEAQNMGRGLEETGRILRYMAFNERANDVALQNGVDEESVKIVTAHHKGDLTETFMMNLFRGAGLDGLLAFKDSKSVIRPLLCVNKEEIIDYLNSLDESYAIDETNSDSSYTRNKWRNDILPLIALASNKNPEDAIMSTNSLLSNDADYLRQVAKSEYEACVRRVNGYAFLLLSEITKLHIAIKSRVIRNLWEETFGNLIDFESIHVDTVLELIKDSKGTKYANLAFGRLALVTNRYIGFCESIKKVELSCAMATDMGFLACKLDESITINSKAVNGKGLTVNLPQTDVVIKADIVENDTLKVYNNTSWFCKPMDLVIETIDLSKSFTKAGSSKESDIMKLLSDLKVPRDARESLITVSSGDKILWIPGVGHADGFLSPKSYKAWYNDGNQDEGELLLITLDKEGDNNG